jgi:hypothetical protein
MQKRLLPLILPFTLALGLGCTPVTADSDSSGGSSGSSSGGSSGSNSSSGGKGGSNASGGSSGNASGGSDGTGSGGSSGSSGGSTGSSGGSSGSTSGGSTGSSGGSSGQGGAGTDGGSETGTPPAGGSPASVLDKFVFDVPCPDGTVKAAGNCTIPDANARKKTKMITMGGDPNTTYKVKLHVCAPMEGRGYSGCATGPESKIVCMDGMPMPGQFQVTYPAYSMTVSAPMHKYYLNNAYKADDIAKIEYSSTFEIKGGASITFETDGGSNADVYTANFKNHNFMCPGAPGIEQPFKGQFIYTTVEAVDPMN